LFVIVSSHADPRFERRGPHLWRSETIQVSDAVLGTSLTIPTLTSEATVKVPPGTQPNGIFRLAGEGLPQVGGRRRGDIYLVVHVHLPTELSAEERELYERLRQVGSNLQEATLHPDGPGGAGKSS
jgi:DnaJ-class molecular chaperone